MRVPMIAGNWKMNTTVGEATELVSAMRAELLKFLNDNGVDAKTHYSIAIHKQDGFPWGKEFEIVGSVENSERNAETCISLPMFPELTDEEVDFVIAKVREFFGC